MFFGLDCHLAICLRAQTKFLVKRNSVRQIKKKGLHLSVDEPSATASLEANRLAASKRGLKDPLALGRFEAAFVSCASRASFSQIGVVLPDTVCLALVFN